MFDGTIHFGFIVFDEFPERGGPDVASKETDGFKELELFALGIHPRVALLKLCLLAMLSDVSFPAYWIDVSPRKTFHISTTVSNRLERDKDASPL